MCTLLQETLAGHGVFDTVYTQQTP